MFKREPQATAGRRRGRLYRDSKVKIIFFKRVNNHFNSSEGKAPTAGTRLKIRRKLDGRDFKKDRGGDSIPFWGKVFPPEGGDKMQI